MSQAGPLNELASPTIATQYVTDSGTAVPAANILNVFGGTGIATAGAGNTITISITSSVGTTITGTSGGPLTPVAGNWNIFGASVAAGSTPVATSGAGNTLTVNVQKSQAIAATDATKVGLSAFNSAQFTVDANGFVALAGGGVAIDSVAVQTGASPIAPTAAGLITINGATVAAGTNPVRTDGTGANTLAVEVQISQAIAAADATKIGLSNFDSASFAVDGTGFVTASGTGILKTLSGDSGTASPIAGNIQIAGGPGVTTSASGAIVTINSVVFTDTAAATIATDTGIFATAAGTYPLPATAAQGEMVIVVCDTAGAVVIDAPALNFIRVGSQITSSGGTATSNAIGDSLTLRYRLSSLTWEAVSVVGTWTLA